MPSKIITRALDSVQETSETGRLPGKWGLVQDLLSIWTPPLDGIRALDLSKRLLDTTAMVRSSLVAQRGYISSLEAWLEENDEWTSCLPSAPYQSLFSIWVWDIMSHLPSESNNISTLTMNIHQVTYQHPKGFEVCFFFGEENAHPTPESPKGIRGPYIKGTPEEALPRLQDILWHDSRHGYTLRNQKTGWGEDVAKLSPSGEPNPYVTEEDGNRLSRDALVKRCQRFLSAGESRRMLFYGPPGTGKTTLTQHMGKEIGEHRVLRLEKSALSSVDDRLIANTVQLLQPRVVLVDDIDRYPGAVSVLLHYLETLHRVPMVFLGTVNVISELDPAMLRPGRFDEIHALPEPSQHQRRRVIDFYIDYYNMEVPGDFADRAEKEMQEFTPADIREVLSCVSKVGVDQFGVECARVKVQREFHSGDAVEKFLSRNRSDDSDDYTEEGW